MKYVRIAVAVVALVLLAWQLNELQKVNGEYSSNIAAIKLPAGNSLLSGTNKEQSDEEVSAKGYFPIRKLEEQHQAEVLSLIANISIIVLGAGLSLYALREG